MVGVVIASHVLFHVLAGFSTIRRESIVGGTDVHLKKNNSFVSKTRSTTLCERVLEYVFFSLFAWMRRRRKGEREKGRGGGHGVG
jgi:hypothetical protein